MAARQSTVALMCEVTEQHRRNDGWTYLAQAGNLAARELPDEIKHLKERYGFKTLKKLLFGAEMFDVMDEPLSEGNFRTLYRLKAGILETTVRLGMRGTPSVRRDNRLLVGQSGG